MRHETLAQHGLASELSHEYSLSCGIIHSHGGCHSSRFALKIWCTAVLGRAAHLETVRPLQQLSATLEWISRTKI